MLIYLINVGLSSYNTGIFTGRLKRIIWGGTHGDCYCDSECVINYEV